jgi:ATP-binding cassette, subfamily D (ALD), member 3
MMSNNISDENIMNLLEEVQLSYLLEREGGLDSVKYWNEELSQGEKFRIIICR